MGLQINIILLVLSAYLMGFAAAVPIGATQLEIARRSLNGYLKSSLMIVAGSVLSDTLYGVIAFFCIAPFLSDKIVIAVFHLLNSIILVLLGIWAIRESRVYNIENKIVKTALSKRHIALITGFSLAVTNPLMIFWWLLGSRMIIDFGIIKQFSQSEIIIFLIAGSLGIGSYLTLLSFGIYKVKRFFTIGGIRKITAVFGIILFGLAIYFIYQSALSFLSIH